MTMIDFNQNLKLPCGGCFSMRECPRKVFYRIKGHLCEGRSLRACALKIRNAWPQLAFPYINIMYNGHYIVMHCTVGNMHAIMHSWTNVWTLLNNKQISKNIESRKSLWMLRVQALVLWVRANDLQTFFGLSWNILCLVLFLLWLHTQTLVRTWRL